jgi:hypothetical protein
LMRQGASPPDRPGTDRSDLLAHRQSSSCSHCLFSGRYTCQCRPPRRFSFRSRNP